MTTASFNIIDEHTVVINGKEIKFSIPIFPRDSLIQLDDLIFIILNSYYAAQGTDDYCRNIYAYNNQGEFVWRISPPKHPTTDLDLPNLTYVGIGEQEGWEDENGLRVWEMQTDFSELLAGDKIKKTKRVVAHEFGGNAYRVNMTDGTVEYYYWTR